MKEMIGERLKALRVGVRLSQTKLAGILGTQQSSINRYEQGQAVPGPEMFVKYADYFDVSMDYLYHVPLPVNVRHAGESRPLRPRRMFTVSFAGTPCPPAVPRTRRWGGRSGR